MISRLPLHHSAFISIDVGTGLAVFVEGPGFTLLYDGGSNDDIADGADNRLVGTCATRAPIWSRSIT